MLVYLILSFLFFVQQVQDSIWVFPLGKRMRISFVFPLSVLLRGLFENKRVACDVKSGAMLFLLISTSELSERK